MKDEKLERITAIGVDVEDALERFLGNVGLLERMLKKFLDDDNYAKLLEAVDKKDAEAALSAAHAMKGMSSNLSMVRLYELLTKQVVLFRQNDAEGAYALMPEITRAYNDMAEGIRNL